MNNKQKALTYVILFSLFWAINIVLVKMVLLEGVQPLLLIFLMFSIAFILSAAFNITFKRKEFKKLNKKFIWKLVLLGVIGSGIANIFTFYGLQLSTAINYGFIIKTGLVFTITLSYFFLNEKITKEKILLACFLIIGAYLISTGGKSYIPHIGDILIVLGAFCYTVSNIIAKPILNIIKPEIVVMFRSFFGGLFILIFISFISVNISNIINPFIIIIMGFVLFLTLTFLNKTLEITTTSYMSMMSMVTPVLVVIMAFFILRETMNMFQVIGGLLIISSGLLIQKTNIHAV